MAASDHLGGQFGAYKLKVTPGSSGMKTSGHVSATSTDPQKPGGGYLSWEHGRIDEVYMDKDHQHKGVATAMYHTATRALGHPLAHSAYRTDDGEGWARSVGGAMPPRRDVGR